MKIINGKIKIETEELGILEGFISLTSAMNIAASRIVAYNDEDVIMKWQLLGNDESIVYKSGKKVQMSTCIINLNELALTPGFTYKLKAAVTARDDKISTVNIVYQPNGGTLYFAYSGSSGLEYRCEYYGNINSLETPPVVKCSSFLGHHLGLTRMMWDLSSNGNTLFISNSQSKRDKWFMDFNTLLINPGTRISVKANVVGGPDSTAFLVLEYDPTSPYTVKTTYNGTIFKTMVMYSGIEIL